MIEAKRNELFIDNASVAGAGYALYNPDFSQSDTVSLGHFITAALLSDRIHLDGSSRLRRIKVVGSGMTPPLGAIWTWERKYPLLAQICEITDDFLYSQEWCAPAVLKYIFDAVSRDGSFPENKIIDSIPDAYRSYQYFDREILERQRELLKNATGRELSENQFLFVTYVWRGLHYHEVAKKQGITYLPNPQRAQFFERFMLPGRILFDSEQHEAIHYFIGVINSPRFTLLQQLEQAETKEYEMNVPPFLHYVLSQCRNSRDEIADVVENLRSSNEFQDFRSLLATYDAAFRKGKLFELKKIKAKLNNSFDNFSKRYSVDERHVRIRPKLPLALLGIDVEAELKIQIPGVLFQEIFQQPYLSFLWRIARESIEDAKPTISLRQLSPAKQASDGVEWVYMANSHELQDDKPLDETLYLSFWEKNLISEDELEPGVRIRDWSKGETHDLSRRPAKPPKNTGA
jgi:hypothetical protein